MDHTGTPDYLWFYCVEYTTNILNCMAAESLGWKTPTETALGTTPDISALLQFSFYEPVYYYDSEQSFPIARNFLVGLLAFLTTLVML